MSLARVSTAVAACVVLGAAVAACSGSFGSGTGLPNTVPSANFGGNASPTPPSTSSSVILTYGESTAFQPLPEVGGYGGSLAFPKAPEPTAAPAAKSKGKKDATPEPAPTPVAVTIGATLSIVKPQDGPDLNFVSGKGKKKRTRELPARALAYITLLPTHDATLESFPRVQLDVPREVASQYRDGEFGLALWNSGEKDSKYRLAVAELDTAATPPPLRQRESVVPAAGGSPGATAKPGGATSVPTATPTSTIRPGASPAPGSSAIPGLGTTPPTAAPTLPPARLLFAGTAAPLKLVANRPAVFALYALPHPATPAPKASSSPAASGSTAPKAAASGAPSGTPSASPAATKAPGR
ncbi:MAG: hypothetical protein M3N49_09095 [Candidatus Eremiobacteraeota bacterium]|nr:hypothetical protein [Candidatus Eremiobacteraeota bacterium]